METFTSFLWAALVTASAAIAGFIVILFAKCGFLPFSVATLLAGAIRLLLTITGTAIIICSVPLADLSFVLWLVILYLLMLIAEVCFAIRIFDEQKEQRFDNCCN